MSSKWLSLIGVLLIALLSGIHNSKAFWHGSGSAFNGLLVQTTLSSPQNLSGEFMPINIFKTTGPWGTVSPAAPVPVNEMNANGYPSNPTNLAAVGGWKTFFNIPSSSQRSGNYNVAWTGSGSTTIDPGATSIVSISGSGCTISGFTVLGANCTAVVNYAGVTNVQLQITAISSGGPTSIQVYHVNDAALIAAGYVCKGSKFASTVGVNFGVVRDMQWSNNINSNEAVWADRTPTSWYSYHGNANYFPASLVTTNQVTVSSGAQYTLAFPGFTLADKGHVIANLASTITPPSFTSTQTVSSGTTLTLNSVTGIVAGMVAGDANSQNALQQTVKVLSVNGGTNTVTFSANPFQGTVTTGDTIYFSPMLNVNGTGSIALVQNTGRPFGTQNSFVQISAHWSTFTYDAALNEWLIANDPNINTGLTGGMPPEVFTQCANEIGAHPWYNLPSYALDPPTDYTLQLATYVKNNLLPGLIPRFEGPNELWNYAYFSTTYADNKEYLRTTVDADHDNWYGRAISQVGQTVSSVYGANRALYQVQACMNGGGFPDVVSVSSGSYNSGTGVVTLTTSTVLPFFGVGQGIIVRGITGTGSVTSVNGLFSTISGSSGTTVKYTIATGLTLTIGPGSAGHVEYSNEQGNKLNSPEYVSNGGSAAYNWVTHVCPTAYYLSSYAGTVTEIGYAYWYANGASSGQKDTLVGNYLAGALIGSTFDLVWYETVNFPGWSNYIASFTGTAPSTLGWSMYEGGYGSHGGCGYNYNCGLVLNNSVTSVTQGATTTLTVGANAWNYICNTASLCTGGQPTTTLTFGGGCGLNGLDPAVLSATATTVTVNVNSTGFTGCTTGTAAYDGAGSFGGYVTAFEIGVKQNTNPVNLQAYELRFLQDFYSAGGRFPAEYDDSDQTDWGKYNPDVYQTNTPVISAIQAFQAAP